MLMETMHLPLLSVLWLLAVCWVLDVTGWITQLSVQVCAGGLLLAALSCKRTRCRVVLLLLCPVLCVKSPDCWATLLYTAIGYLGWNGCGLRPTISSSSIMHDQWPGVACGNMVQRQLWRFARWCGMTVVSPANLPNVMVGLQYMVGAAPISIAWQHTAETCLTWKIAACLTHKRYIPPSSCSPTCQQGPASCSCTKVCQNQ